MISDNNKSQIIDSTIINLPEKDITRIFNVLKVLKARLTSFHDGNDFLLDHLDYIPLANNRRYLMIIDRCYEYLITKLIVKRFVDLRSDELMERTACFQYPKMANIAIDPQCTRGKLTFYAP